jgi:hypothetical protein
VVTAFVAGLVVDFFLVVWGAAHALSARAAHRATG